MTARYWIIIFLTLVFCGRTPGLAFIRLEYMPDDYRDIRDPLLPTDYEKPTDEDQAEEQQQITEQERQRQAVEAQMVWPQLRLRGITHAGQERYFAIIDQIGIVEQGDTITLREGNLVYAWHIDAITDQGITTTRLHVTSVKDPDQPIRIIYSTTGQGAAP